MPLFAIPVWAAALICAMALGLLLIMCFAVVHAKRDVTINITLLEVNR